MRCVWSRPWAWAWLARKTAQSAAGSKGFLFAGCLAPRCLSRPCRPDCAAEGRDYDAIEKTVQVRYDLGENGERVEQTIEHLHELSELGITVAHGTMARVGTLRPIELMAERVIPAIDKF